MMLAPLTPAERILSTIRRKHSKNEWRFDYHPNRRRWETYRLPLDWPEGLYKWLNETFDRPGDGSWDYHGGWIYFYDERCLTLFTLRWA